VEHTGKAAIAEFVATFALIVVGAGAVILHTNGQLDLTGVALANGLVLAAMGSVTAHLSGALANPAVAISLWVTGKLPTGRAGVLVGAQVAGAVAGAFLLRFLLPTPLFESGSGGIPALGDGIATGKGIVIEAVATFFLVFAVFGTVVDDRRPSPNTSGLTIGLVLAVDMLAFFPYTGAAANPARWFGPALATTDWSSWSVWIVGPIAGGIIASVLYWSVFLKREDPAPP
jgi:MIP family channel proteins